MVQFYTFDCSTTHFPRTIEYITHLNWQTPNIFRKLALPSTSLKVSSYPLSIWFISYPMYFTAPLLVLFLTNHFFPPPESKGKSIFTWDSPLSVSHWLFWSHMTTWLILPIGWSFLSKYPFGNPNTCSARKFSGSLLLLKKWFSFAASFPLSQLRM